MTSPPRHAPLLARRSFTLPLAALAALVACACENKPSGGAAPATAAPGALSKGGADAESAAPSATTSAASGDGKDPLAALSLGTIFRDDEEVTLDGVKESWRLEWARPPIPDCMGSGWDNCPCAGFAFGERGDLDLVRTRPGKPDERLRLDPLFEGNDARVQRWPVTKSDAEGALRDGGAALDLVGISMRPVTSVIKFGDYDHDGRASEFLLQVAAGPCGHTPTLVVGISKTSPKLHAFGTAEKPNEPLTFDHASDWEKLRAKPSADVVMIACGDHGATEQTVVHVTADGDFHAKTETKKCP